MAIINFEANRAKAMAQIAEQYIEQMRKELRISGKYTSGKDTRNGDQNLADSFKYTIEGTQLRIFSENRYAGAVDFGRGPSTRKGGDKFGRTLGEAITDWLIEKNIRIRRTDNGRFVPNASGGYLRAASYAISTKIHEVGYKGINFSAYAMDQLRNKIPEELGEAYLDEIQKTVRTNFLRKIGAGEFTTIKVQ